MVEEKFIDSKSDVNEKDTLEDMVKSVETCDLEESNGKLNEHIIRDSNIWSDSNKKLKRRSEDNLSNGNKKTKHEEDDINMMDGDIFDWPSYLLETKSKAVPRPIFKHIIPECMCGFEPGMKLEVPNKDYKNTYWLATIVAKATPLILVRYEGFQDNNEEDFWCNTLSDDIHPVGWCARTKHALKPPKSIQGKEQNWYTYLITNLTGAKKASENLFLKKSHPAHYLRAGQYVEILDPYNPLCYWLARVNEVFQGRLNLQYEGWDGKDGELWCFYLHENLRPVGYGIKNGLTLYSPKGSGTFSQAQITRLTDKITALSKRINSNIFDSLFMGWTDKSPHGLNIGMKLEGVHPKFPTSVYAASVSRIFNEHYFLIQIDTLLSTQDDVSNSFVAHKDSPLIFPVGFCSKNGLTLCQPSGYIGKFTWEAYLKYTKAEPVPESFFPQEITDEEIEVGMKLEAMDKEHPSHICVCTITKIVGNHLWLKIDGDTRSDQIFSIKSCDIFPTGWCESTGHELQWPRPNTLEQKNRISSLRSTISRQNRLEVLRKGKLHEVINESTLKDTTKKEIKQKRKSRYLKGHRGHSRKRINYDDSDTIADNTIPIVCINQLAKEYNTEEHIKKSFRLDSNGRLPKEVVTIDDDEDEDQENVTPTCKNERKFTNGDIDYLSYLRIKPKNLTKSEDELFKKRLMENDGNQGAAVDALNTPNNLNRERRSLNTVVDMLRSSTKQSRTQLLEQYKQSKARRNEFTIIGKENTGFNSKDRTVIDLCDDDEAVHVAVGGINHNSYSQDDPINIPGRGEYRIVEKIVQKQGDKNKIILKLGKPTPNSSHSTSFSSPATASSLNVQSDTLTTTPVSDMHSIINMVRNQPGLNEILKTRCHKVRTLCKDLPKNPLLWTKRHVAMFIQNADFKKYAKRFFDQDVDGHSLLLLTVWEIHHILGVHLGPAMKIHDYIFSLQQLVNDAYLKSKNDAQGGSSSQPATDDFIVLEREVIHVESSVPSDLLPFQKEDEIKRNDEKGNQPLQKLDFSATSEEIKREVMSPLITDGEPSNYSFSDKASSKNELIIYNADECTRGNIADKEHLDQNVSDVVEIRSYHQLHPIKVVADTFPEYTVISPTCNDTKRIPIQTSNRFPCSDSIETKFYHQLRSHNAIPVSSSEYTIIPTSSNDANRIPIQTSSVFPYRDSIETNVLHQTHGNKTVTVSLPEYSLISTPSSVVHGISMQTSGLIPCSDVMETKVFHQPHSRKSVTIASMDYTLITTTGSAAYGTPAPTSGAFPYRPPFFTPYECIITPRHQLIPIHYLSPSQVPSSKMSMDHHTTETCPSSPSCSKGTPPVTTVAPTQQIVIPYIPANYKHPVEVIYQTSPSLPGNSKRPVDVIYPTPSSISVDFKRPLDGTYPTSPSSKETSYKHSTDITYQQKRKVGESLNSMEEARTDSLTAPISALSTDHPWFEKYMRKVHLELESHELWNEFHKLGTEMILTRAGRRMFPTLQVSVTGLNPKSKYVILVDFAPADHFRYKFEYETSSWLVACEETTPPPGRVYIHPESPAMGDEWMRNVVDFTKCKLTNNLADRRGHILMHSMHKYQPRVHVIYWDGTLPLRINPFELLRVGCRKEFVFPQTQFIAVTAYQNSQITHLKIESNPFARGFRGDWRKYSEGTGRKAKSRDKDEKLLKRERKKISKMDVMCDDISDEEFRKSSKMSFLACEDVIDESEEHRKSSQIVFIGSDAKNGKSSKMNVVECDEVNDGNEEENKETLNSTMLADDEANEENHVLDKKVDDNG